MTDTTLARRGGQQAIAEPAPRALTWEMIEELTGYDQAQIALVARTVVKDAPMQEIVMFLHACKTLNLDPLLRQAYWIRRKDGDVYKGTLQVGIDGYRSIAERSGVYAGSEPAEFRGSMEIVYQNRKILVPETARILVWKIVAGHKAAFTGEAHWTEFCPREQDAFMWRKMPRHMLAKCAEGQALRKAFPALLGAVNMAAEMGEAGDDLPEVGVPTRIVEQPQPERSDREKAAQHKAMIDDEYDAQDRGWTPPPSQPESKPAEDAESTEMVKSARHALSQEMADLVEKLAAADIDPAPYTVNPPAPAAAFREKIAAAKQALDRSQAQPSQEAFG